MPSFPRLRATFCFAVMFALSGCFQPVYGGANGSAVIAKAAEVRIEPIDGRAGHFLSDELISRMGGVDPVEPRYRLTVHVTMGDAAPVVESQVGVATSSTFSEHAAYELVRLSDGKVLTKSETYAFADYDRGLQAYSNLRATRDAEQRVARTLASEIELRIAQALSAE